MIPRGRLGDADRRRVRGWALDEALPEAPVSLVVAADDIALGRVVANAYRPDPREVDGGTPILPVRIR